ncbi:hypothetical protein GCM10009766_22890 [Microcella frigidaquae]
MPYPARIPLGTIDLSQARGLLERVSLGNDTSDNVQNAKRDHKQYGTEIRPRFRNEDDQELQAGESDQKDRCCYSNQP